MKVEKLLIPVITLLVFFAILSWYEEQIPSRVPPTQLIQSADKIPAVKNSGS
ncbi:hypothetical protein [Beggiatoa leptomitoformis]|uniref:Uncharacterized protein n=1 Tax=Beggiatoa leptomitoformis TaxID=288004 RepID=A0A650GE20_9GAMM|nr:hypothetical protein [Beggiatoa leptomitoformis]QGX03572.1 hypothetical protein AL038_18615 [Beggiatoa leptomitoformis]QGX04059.1 hypothetical protein BLE401_18510 [Beggiatoa leptomitoformis]